MTLCKFFAQGNCRFGDRCRFEHPEPYQDYRGKNTNNQYYRSNEQYHDYPSYGYEDPPRRNDYNDYNRPNQQFNQAYSRNKHSNRYEVLEDYDDYESPGRHKSAMSNYDYEEEWYSPTKNAQYGNRYEKNKHEWVSEDYKKSNYYQQQQKTSSFFQPSSPKSQTSFSFKDSKAQTRKEPNDLHMNAKNLAIAEVIKDDATSWEHGKVWPFTCYSPILNRALFPWFDDVSPEELRWEAYKSSKSNAYDFHVQSVRGVMQDVQTKRNLLKEPSLELMSLIERIRAGEDLSFEMNGTGLSLLSNDQIPFQVMSTGSPATDVKQAAAAFSFKTSTETDSAPKTSAANFSFKSTATSQPSSQDSDVYTPMETLTSEDKEQFTASTFSLGKIPTDPPPQALCF